MHTFSFEILLAHIVVILPEFDIKNSAIYVNSSISLNILHMKIICTLGWPFSRSELPRVPTGLLRLKIASLNPHVFQKTLQRFGSALLF